jgi:hypothetical protein
LKENREDLLSFAAFAGLATFFTAFLSLSFVAGEGG